MEMDQGDRVRRQAPAPFGGGTPASKSTSGSSSAIGGTGDINYIQAARAGVARFAFEHTHLIKTWGNACSISTLGQDQETKIMMTSLACIPVNALSFWMTYAEYRDLPRGTRVESIECIVIPKGFKSSWIPVLV